MLYTREWIVTFCVATRDLPSDVQEKIFQCVCDEHVCSIPATPRKERRRHVVVDH